MMYDQLTGAAIANASISAVGAATVVAFSEQVQIVMIGGIVAIVTSVATLYFAYKAKTLSQEARDASNEAKDTSHGTAVAVDGKMEKLLELAKALSHEEGRREGTVEAEGKAGIKDAAIAEGRAQVEGGKLTPAQIEKMIQELQAQLKDKVDPPA